MFKVGDKVKRIITGGGRMSTGDVGVVEATFTMQGVDKLVISYKNNDCMTETGIFTAMYYEHVSDTNECALKGLCTVLDSISEQYAQLKTNLPDRYIINEGATVLFWPDDTKTIVRKTKDDRYDKRLGFLYAYFQKTSGLSRNKANKYIETLIEVDNKKIMTTKEIKKQLPNFTVKANTKKYKVMPYTDAMWENVCKAYADRVITNLEAAEKLHISKDAFYYRYHKEYDIKEEK